MKFTDVLSTYSIQYRRRGESQHVTEGWIGLECPFCGKGTGKFGLGYNISGRYLTCWKCGPHSVVDTLKALTDLPIKKCFELVGEVDSERSVKEKPKGTLILPKGIKELLKPHKRYLRNREFDPVEIVNLWQVAGIGVNGGHLAWRIFIPVIYQGKMVSFTTRSLSDKGMRYIAAGRDEEAVPHKSLLYGEDYCTHSVIVHEGPTDAWATGPGAVATMGLGCTKAQLLRISKYPVRVICFDSDRKSQQRAAKLCRELEPFPGETYRVELSGKDAASSPKEEIQELRSKFLTGV